MTLHMIKLAVGAESINDMMQWQARRRAAQGELLHTTRMVPKRAADILHDGSLYWVIKGFIRLRQRIIDIRPFSDDEGIRRCHLVFDARLVPVRPTPRRPFQGWRYLAPKEVPPDLSKGERAEQIPEDMRVELSKLGLL